MTPEDAKMLDQLNGQANYCLYPDKFVNFVTTPRMLLRLTELARKGLVQEAADIELDAIERRVMARKGAESG